MTAHQTIDTHEAIHFFCNLMKNTTHERILCLVGDGKMGKSHLLTHVFPLLAERDYQARCAILDLGYPFSTIPDVLSQICTQLGGDQCFRDYYSAEEELMRHPKVDVKGLRALFSHVTVSNRDHQDEASYQARYLTSHFIQSISQLTDQPLLLLFDSIEKASEEMQGWLMKNLLLSLFRLKHVRVVLAGRSLPEPYISYSTHCQHYKLCPVIQIDEYVTYCQQSNLLLSGEQIRTLAHAFDYIPGLFVDVLPKFATQKVTHV